MNYPASVPVIFGSVVDTCRNLVLPELQAYNNKIETVQYIYSPLKEMIDTLVQMGKGRDASKLRFPLIWLEENINETRGSDGFYADVSLHVWIMYQTTQTFKSSVRETQIFDPILRPIYWNLMKALSMSIAFNSPDESRIPHSKTDHKFLGTDQQTQNVLTDFVDAIELSNLSLQVNYADCITPIPFTNN